MNKTNIIGIAIVVVALGGIAWVARPNPESDASSPPKNSSGPLSAEEKRFDFGTISMAAGNVSHTFKIKNASSKPITIGKMYTSCMCTTARLEIGDKKFGPYGMPGHGFIPKINKIINPSGEAMVEVIFDPAAHGPAGVGRIERSITIENSVGKPLELGFIALVTP